MRAIARTLCLIVGLSFAAATTPVLGDKRSDDPVWVRFARQKWYPDWSEDFWPYVPQEVAIRGNHRSIGTRLNPGIDISQDQGPWQRSTGHLVFAADDDQAHCFQDGTGARLIAYAPATEGVDCVIVTDLCRHQAERITTTVRGLQTERRIRLGSSSSHVRRKYGYPSLRGRFEGCDVWVYLGKPTWSQMSPKMWHRGKRPSYGSVIAFVMKKGQVREIALMDWSNEPRG
jgi:hypothetical protein